MREKISVIVPVYNVEPYLQRCVESITQQTYSNLEIFLIDDGSTDNSGVFCDSFAEKDTRIRVIHQKNQGLSAARNVGLDLATGEWVAFLDSDDWIEPQMYEVLERLAKQHNADIASCLSRDVIPNIPLPQISDSLEELILSRDEMIGGLVTQQVVRFEVWNKLFKRAIIGDVRFKLKQVSEDVYFDRIIFMKSNKMIHIDQTLHNYLRVRPGNTNSSFKAQRLCIFDEFDEFMLELKAENKTDLFESIGYVALTFSIAIYVEAVTTKQSREMKDQLLSIYRKYRTAINHSKYIRNIMIFLYDLHPMLYYWASKLKHALIG